MDTELKFSVLGCGRWGSFIAWYLNKTNHKVILWGRNDGFYQTLSTTRKNEYMTLPDKIELTNDLEYAVKNSHVIAIVISAQGVRELMQNISKIDDYKNKKYLLCMKGIEDITGKRLSTVLEECGVPQSNIAAFVGPGHIQSLLTGTPTLMVVDSNNKDLSNTLQMTLNSELIKVYQGNDMLGTEIGAAAKNVLGIAAGMLDGSNKSELKGGLMARGAREISNLIKSLGGNELSAYGLAHLGDFEATLFSKFSNNRMWGEKFAKGEYFEKLAEGVATTSALLKLAKPFGVKMPITQAIYDVINKKTSIDEAIKSLILIETTTEF